MAGVSNLLRFFPTTTCSRYKLHKILVLNIYFNSGASNPLKCSSSTTSYRYYLYNIILKPLLYVRGFQPSVIFKINRTHKHIKTNLNIRKYTLSV